MHSQARRLHKGHCFGIDGKSLFHGNIKGRKIKIPLRAV